MPPMQNENCGQCCGSVNLQGADSADRSQSATTSSISLVSKRSWLLNWMEASTWIKADTTSGVPGGWSPEGFGLCGFGTTRFSRSLTGFTGRSWQRCRAGSHPHPDLPPSSGKERSSRGKGRLLLVQARNGEAVAEVADVVADFGHSRFVSDVAEGAND